jgi:hypothetical protein
MPFITTVVVLVFVVLVFRRYFAHRTPYLLLWGIGLVLYGIGTLTEALNASSGFSELGFRLWYLCGAMLVAAYLGQGTVYLLVRRKIGNIRLAHILMAVLLLATIYGVIAVFGAELDPSQLEGDSLSGAAIVSSGVRGLTPFFNIYGTLFLVGGALYSAWIFWRKRIMRHRVIGNVLIAAGAMLVAASGTSSRFGSSEWLYVGELVAAVLMFVGFLESSRREE